MDTARKRSRIAVAAAAAIAGSVGFGVALADSGTGQNVSPWITTHGHVAMADGAGAGKVTIQPFLITKKGDKASPSLF